VWKLYSFARKKGNLAVATTNLRNLTDAVKLLGTFTRELQDSSVAIGVNVNVGRAVWADSTDAALRWASGRHFLRLTGFEPQAIEDLKLLAAGPCPQCGRVSGCQHDL
jgi:hypothetical protein